MNEVRVTYFIKKDKTNSLGLAPIFGKIIYMDTHSFFSAKMHISPEDWEKYRTSKRKSAEDKKIHLKLAEYETQLLSIQNQLKASKQKYTAKRLKKILFKKESVIPKEPDKITIRNAMSELINEKQGLIKCGRRSEASMTKYRTVERHFFNFLRQSRNLEDIALTDMKFNLITDFYLYLIGEKTIDGKKEDGISNNTSQKYIQNFRGTVQYAMKMDYIDKDPFFKYVYEWDKKDPIYLTKIELAQIEEKQLSNKRLEVIKDIFLFSCYSGYAPIDLKFISPDCIELRDDGEYWFNMSRKKTKIKSDVMLFPQTLALIEKYKNDPHCLSKNMVIPYRANQTMNEYLKELADACGIKKKLHHYVARHTFATTIMIENGASLEVVMKALGQKRITQTQHYARITDMRSSQEMKHVKQNLKGTESEKESQNNLKVLRLDDVSEKVYSNEMKLIRNKLNVEKKA